MDSQGTPNLVEEGEVIYNDYVFSNRMNIPDDVRKKYLYKNINPANISLVQCLL